MDIIVGTAVETTHNTTGHFTWHKAEVVKVTANFCDIRTESFGVSRFRLNTCEERSDYCGFRAKFRLPK